MLQVDQEFVGSRIVVNGTSALATEIARSFIAAGAVVVHSAGDDTPAGSEGASADLSTRAGVDAFARRALQRLGDVDVIINVAAPLVATVKTYLELSDDDVRSDINTTFMSAQRLDRALMPRMMERREGVIIHVTSGEAGLGGGPSALSLKPMEAALASYSRSLATYLGPYGIRVNVVVAGNLAAAPAGNGGEPIPLGRRGELHEVSELVAFLASPKASYITGAQYVVDGGQHRAIQI